MGSAAARGGAPTSSPQVPLLPHLVRRANPFADVIVDLVDAAQPEVVQVIARGKRLHGFESRMLQTFGSVTNRIEHTTASAASAKPARDCSPRLSAGGFQVHPNPGARLSGRQKETPPLMLRRATLRRRVLPGDAVLQRGARAAHGDDDIACAGAVCRYCRLHRDRIDDLHIRRGNAADGDG